MPHISLKDLQISVSLNDVKNSDIDPRTIRFFKACGGEFNSEYTSYVTEKYLSITHLYVVLSDIVKVLKEKNWNITYDSESTNLLSRHKNDTSNLASAQAIA